MKKLLVAILIAVLSTQVSAQTKTSTASMEKTAAGSNKNLDTKEMVVENFNTIKTNSPINVKIVKSADRKIIINSNRLDVVVAEVKNGELIVGYSNTNRIRNAKTFIEIYTPDFNNLNATTTSQVQVDGGFEFKTLYINLSSVAHITGDFTAENLEIYATSSANFSGKIKTDRLKLNADSTSRVDAAGIANIVNAKAQSLGEINIKNLSYTSLEKSESTLGEIITK